MLKDIYPYFRELHIFISYPIHILFAVLRTLPWFFLLRNVVFVYTCYGEKLLFAKKNLCTFVADSCSVHSSLFSRKVVY
jgi:hypothetical protein